MVRAELPKRQQGRNPRRRSCQQLFQNGHCLNAKYCKLFRRADGNGYGWRPAPTAETGALTAEGSDEQKRFPDLTPALVAGILVAAALRARP
jgi:hypothetical protein